MKDSKIILIIIIILIHAQLGFSQNVDSIGYFSNFPDLWNVAVSGNYLFGVKLERGLEVIDISDPSEPVFVDSLNTFYGEDIHISGSYAYVIGERSLTIVNISDPPAPIVEGRCEVPWYIHTLDVRDNYAYLGEIDEGGFSHLLIADISVPTSPTLMGSCQIFGLIFGIAVSGNYAYIAAYGSHLKIVNVADPYNPIYVDSCLTPSNSHAIAIFGNYVYIADGWGGLEIIDVAHPPNPLLVGHYYTRGHAVDIAVENNLVFLSEDGLDVVDVSDPTNPILVGRSRYSSHNIFEIDNNIYLADYSGLGILRFNPTGINNDIPIPSTFFLSQNYPNPFNASTSISYSLAKGGSVNLAIYNLLGQKVATLSDGIQQAGEHSIIWNANDFPSGIYFSRLNAAGETKNIKMVLLK